MIYEKKILSPGTYAIRGKNGEVQRVYISRERIKRWVQNFKKMTENGLKIPAPWRHDESEPIRTVGDDADVTSDNNAGWWKSLRESEDGSLWGEVEVPREADTSKIGTTVQDVSPLVRPEFIDGGTGETYEDAITHIALVTHPVVPNQENFNAIALSSENMISEQDTTSQGSALSLTEALRCLKSRGISLPKDTTIENLVERLVVACQAIESAEMESEEDNSDEDIETPPKNSKTQPDPIVMANETLKLSAEDQAKINFATRTIKKSYEDRIASCVENGQVTQEMVTKVKPLLENYELQLSAEGEIVPSALDTILESWEAIPQNALLGSVKTKTTKSKQKTTLALSQGIQVQELPDDSEDDFDPDAIIAQQFANSGMSNLLR